MVVLIIRSWFLSAPEERGPTSPAFFSHPFLLTRKHDGWTSQNFIFEKHSIINKHSLQSVIHTNDGCQGMCHSINLMVVSGGFGLRSWPVWSSSLQVWFWMVWPVVLVKFENVPGGSWHHHRMTSSSCHDIISAWHHHGMTSFCS